VALPLRGSKLRFAVAAAVSVLVLQLLPGKVSAAGGITVSPAVLNVSLTKAQPEQDVAITVKNDFSVPVQLIANLYAVDQQRSLVLPLKNTPSDLSKLSSVTPSIIDIEAGKSINLQLHIKDGPSLAPGGHYAALVIKQVASDQANIPLEPAVSIGLFVIKEGGAVRKLAVETPELSGIALHMPSFIDLRFSNKGNVQVVPRAGVSITGRQALDLYLKGVVNADSVPVVPKNDITLRSALITTKKAYFPGRYTVAIEYRYDGQSTPQLVTQHFWYIPLWSVLILLLLIAGGFGLYRWRATFSRFKWVKNRKKRRIESKKTASKATKIGGKRKIVVKVVDDSGKTGDNSKTKA
jgi:hypothetical protein